MNTNKHGKQIFWQIYLPLILIIGVFAYSIISLFGNSTFNEMSFRIWSDISILVITLPIIFFFTFILILILLKIYLIFKLQPAISNAFLKTRSVSESILGWANKLTNHIIHPVILIESLFSQVPFNKKDKEQD
jgi:hypothetical protein